MRCSVYHFFAHLIAKRAQFINATPLGDFPFPKRMLSCVNKGIWPDLAIRLNKNDRLFTGGELIELKDAKGFNVSSFNSTIPLGRKDIASLIGGKSNKIRKQMEEAGDDILSLRTREVYYLIRGNKSGVLKVCLSHGKFFETISESDLIGGAFKEMLDERIQETGVTVDDSIKEKLVSIFTKHDTFAQSRKVKKASVKLRFRIMTEVAPEGNVFLYPEIADNSLTLLVPFDNSEKREEAMNLMRVALHDQKQDSLWQEMNIMNVSHRLNGPFVSFQVGL